MDPLKTSQPVQPATILIVDDNADSVTAISELLVREKYVILSASNGVEGLAVAAEHHLDLILLDVHMPVMDGFETIKNLRMMKKVKYTPIVFLTGYGTTPTAIESGFELGGAEYWTKPIVPAELIVRVRAILRIAETERTMRKLQQAFYSMVVHDLRNPIGAILGSSEFLMEDAASFTKDQAELVEGINTASVQLLRIVTDLLDLSNLESGEYAITHSDVLLAGMVADVVGSMGTMRGQKNINVSVDIDKTLEVSIDREYFREILENVLDNALRFTPANGAVTFTARHSPQAFNGGKGETIIEVSDTGCGIAEELIPTLFEKSRITNPRFRKANTRTGLGLVICREIIEAHGGTIAVASTVGKGTTLTLVLPDHAPSHSSAASIE